MNWKNFALAGLILFVLSCSGGGSDPSNFSAGSLYGKVIDSTTRAGIADATVSLYVDGDAKTATTAEDDTDTTDYNEAGDFKITSIRDGSHRLRIAVTGYATYEQLIAFANPSRTTAAYSVMAGANGTIALLKGCSVNVYVTAQDTGAVIPGVSVYVGGGGAVTPEVTATTDIAGLATLGGLAQNTIYTITAAPFDTDGDGNYNFLTGTLALYNCSNSATTAAINMPVARPNDALTVIGGSFQNYLLSEPSMLGNIVDTPPTNETEAFGFSPTAGATISFVFNYPITTVDTDNTYLNYTRDLVLASDAQHGNAQEVAVSAALSAGNTILTLTPTSAVANETYTLEGVVTSTINGTPRYYRFSDLTFTDLQNNLALNLGNWYAFSDTALTIDQVSIDNYNNVSDGSLAASVPYLEFPQYVYGFATVISVTSGGVTTNYNNAGEIDLDDSPAGNVWLIDEDGPDGVAGGTDKGCNSDDDTACGTHGDVKWAVPINGVTPNLADNTTGALVTVTVFVDATDYAGNHIADEVTLAVQ